VSNGKIIILCQTGQFNGFLNAKWGDYSYMSNGAIQWILSAKWGDYNYMLK